MASVEKRTRDGKVRWYARYRDPSGQQRTKTFDRKVDAERFLTSVEGSKLAGAYIDPARAKTTVGTVADQWKAGKINLKPTTRARYESALDVHVLKRWRDVPLERVEHGDIQAWLSDLIAAGQSAASVRKCFGVLSSILALAVRDRRIPSSPAAGIMLPRVVDRPRRYLTAVQVTQLAAAAAIPPHERVRAAYAQYRLAVFVLAYCGLRWSELAALRVRSVDLMRKRLDVAEAVTEVNGAQLVWGTPKSHERRSVPLPGFLVDELTPHLAGRAQDALVFTTLRGAPMRNRNARRDWFDDAAEAIGEPDLTPHGLRHTAASLAVSAGANVKAVQRMLGHASAAMTLDQYADLFDDDLDAVAERLDVVARAAGVYPLCTGADVVPLAKVSRKAADQ
ncbi:MAG: site-specific integrase [Actinomycetota bacterium]|nr:site-specific integrase [Actinomycetota bacterium]